MRFKSFDFQLIHKKSLRDSSPFSVQKSITKSKKISKENKQLQQNHQKYMIQSKEREELFILNGNVVIDLKTLFHSATSQMNQTHDRLSQAQFGFPTDAQNYPLQNQNEERADSVFFKENVIYNQAGTITSVEYFKKIEALEVTYDSAALGFFNSSYQEFIAHLNNLLYQNTIDFQQKSNILNLKNAISKYEETIKTKQPPQENEISLRNQQFEVSMKIAHQYLLGINQKQYDCDLLQYPQIYNYLPRQKQLDKQKIKSPNSDLFFYYGLKRTEYGYSIDRKGLNKNLMDLLKFEQGVLLQAILRKGFINFFTEETNINLLLFDIEARMKMVQQQSSKLNNSLSDLKGKRIKAELITLDLLNIPCEIIIDIVQISYSEEGWSQNYLMLFYIEINENEYEKFKVSQDSLNNLSTQYEQSQIQSQQQHNSPIQYQVQQHQSQSKQEQQKQKIQRLKQQSFSSHQERFSTDLLFDNIYSNQSESFIQNFYPDYSPQSSLNSILTPN